MSAPRFVIAKPATRGRRYFRAITHNGVVWETTYRLSLAKTFATREAAQTVLVAASKDHEGWDVIERPLHG